MLKVEADLESAGLLEGEALVDLAEIELLLDFADWMFDRLASVWASASYINKLRIQYVLFPNELTVSQEGLGTPKCSILFKELGKKLPTT